MFDGSSESQRSSRRGFAIDGHLEENERIVRSSDRSRAPLIYDAVRARFEAAGVAKQRKRPSEYIEDANRDRSRLRKGERYRCRIAERVWIIDE